MPLNSTRLKSISLHILTDHWPQTLMAKLTRKSKVLPQKWQNKSRRPWAHAVGWTHWQCIERPQLFPMPMVHLWLQLLWMPLLTFSVVNFSLCVFIVFSKYIYSKGIFQKRIPKTLTSKVVICQTGAFQLIEIVIISIFKIRLDFENLFRWGNIHDFSLK